jgi:acetyl/propionyl-CoA carboxylase alpha subunit
VRIGPAPAVHSYLATDAVLRAAKEAGAEAIHPGYGFLAENHTFAAACIAGGLIFVGPPPDVIASLGSKIAARHVAARAGIPVVPGATPADQSEAAVADAARRIGFPVLIKPSAGGGGIGMKAVRDEASLPAAIAQAGREAIAAFGDGTLYVERLIDRPRHVEVQVLLDSHGGAVYLFERECSLQRRHQKIVEEAPSTALTPRLRARMGEAAVALASAAGYRNAGEEARFYFLEMNTRLQVEHPVTEQTTGVDIVLAQLKVAAGEPLPWSQRELSQRGHAIEVRVYAEDPARNDLPQAGPLLLYREPMMPGVRVDSGVVEGGEISVHYDPLIAKLIASADTRERARRRALTALRNYPILGVRTNIAFLIALLEHPRFISGDVDTGFVDVERATLVASSSGDPPAEAISVAKAATGIAAAGSSAPTNVPDPWTMLRGWRG